MVSFDLEIKNVCDGYLLIKEPINFYNRLF